MLPLPAKLDRKSLGSAVNGTTDKSLTVLSPDWDLDRLMMTDCPTTIEGKLALLPLGEILEEIADIPT
jgi:hypothetical protein